MGQMLPVIVFDEERCPGGGTEVLDAADTDHVADGAEGLSAGSRRPLLISNFRPSPQ